MKLKQTVVVTQEEKDTLIKANDILIDICRTLNGCDDCPMEEFCNAFMNKPLLSIKSVIKEVANKLTVEGV